MKLIPHICIIACLAGCSNSKPYAPVVDQPVHYVLIQGHESAPLDISIDIINRAHWKIKKEAGINLQFAGFTTITDPSPELDGLDAFYSAARYGVLGSYAKNYIEGCQQPGVHCHIIDRPILDQNKLWCAGRAPICRVDFSYSTAKIENANDIGRVPHSVVVLVHELLHMLGAGHIDDTPNVMNSDALRFVDEFGASLPIEELTVDETNQCRGLVNEVRGS